MPSPTLTLKHFTSAANVVADSGTILTSDFNRSVEDVLSDTGAIVLRLPNTDASVATSGDTWNSGTYNDGTYQGSGGSTATPIDLGHYIQARLDGTAVFLARVESIDRTLIDDSEEHGQITKIECRGAVADWAKPKVQPSTPIGSKLWQRDRLFGWMCPELVTTGFSAAVQQWQQNIDDSAYSGKIGMPLGWFDPSGYWIWSTTSVDTPPLHDPGTSYFYADLVLAADTDVALHIACDDAFACYVDGVTAAASGDVNGWQRGFRTIMSLEAGTHRIAVEGENFDRTASTNTAGLIAAVYSLDTSGKEDTLLLRTNNTDWKCVHYPASPPGVSASTVVSTLLTEAQADGELTAWTVSATGTFDDDQFTFPVGMGLLDVLLQLSETHIDFSFDPDAFVLNITPYGQMGSSTSVATLTSSLSAHSVKERDAGLDGLLVLYSDGYTSVGTAGRQEFLALGAARTSTEAEAVATAELARLAGPLESVSIEVAPDSGAFSTYSVGDVVTIPDIGGGTTTKRIRAINVQDDGDAGQVKVTPELADRLDPMDIRTARAVRRMVDGTVNGRSLSASLPAVSSGVTTQRVELEIDSFDWNSTGDATLEDLENVEQNPMKFAADGRIAWIRYEWNTAPAANATVVGKIAGLTVFTHTLPSGDTGHSEFPNQAISRGQKLTLTLTSVDATGRGLTAKIHQAVYV